MQLLATNIKIKHLYFIYYAIMIVLDFPPLLASIHIAPPAPSGNPHTLVHVHGSWYKFFVYSISYTVLYIPIAIL